MSYAEGMHVEHRSDPGSGARTSVTAPEDAAPEEEILVEEEMLVEEISIDGVCGVY